MIFEHLSILSFVSKNALKYFKLFFPRVNFFFCFSGRTPGQAAEDHPFGAGGRYLPHTSSSSGLCLGLGGQRRRSTESRESLASRESAGGGTASSTLRRERQKSLSRRGSRHRCEAGHPHPQGPRSPHPAPVYSKKELGLSEPGKTPTQDASDR